MRWPAIAALMFLLPIACGCGKNAAPGKAEAAPEKAETAAEPADQGICKEHGVLEALCTKCNPAIAAVFQAKGDWCKEHGFPESVCPKCRPERGGKPAVDVATDGAPADGTKVLLKTKETARIMGIETTKAEKGHGVSEIVAPAMIAYDATRVAKVNARTEGVVRMLYADVGTWVPAGASLAQIESASIGADQSRLSAAKSRVQLAETKYRRETDLQKRGISARMEVEAAEQEWEEAKSGYAALSSSLSVAGAVAGSAGKVTITAPFSGVVTQRNASVGQYIGTEQALFEIVDTSSMWAEVAIPETELASVRSGSAVVLTFDGLGSREFRGTVAHIAPEIDAQTRTAKARVRVANHSGLLRANLYGKARIPVGGSRPSTSVPRAAIQRAKSVRLAFVRLAADEYEARRVQVIPGQWEGGNVEVGSGIEPGEEIVTAGSFFLKTETLKNSIGAGCCPGEAK